MAVSTSHPVSLVHLALTAPFLAAYARWSGANLGAALRHRWVWGIVGATAAGLFVVANVLSQEASPRPEGLALAANLAWFGVVYAVLDALLLSVLPVTATWRAAAVKGWVRGWKSRLAVGAGGMAGSLLVTAVYHAGFTEYRGQDLVAPLMGNGSLTLAFLLTGNPVAAVLGHLAMHIAAVLHGFDTAVLPPHLF